jgi:hypothetical protein
VEKSVENSVGSKRSGGERSGGELWMELKKRVVKGDGVFWCRKIVYMIRRRERTH